MRGHVDAETLAAFREGLLPRRRAARVRAHVAGCPLCAETDARLAGVSSLLASSQVPPMPAGLASRIEAALAAEAASRAEPGAAARAAGGRSPGDARRTRHAGDAGRAAGGPAADGDGLRAGRRPPRRAAHRPADRRSWLALRAAAVTAAVAVIAGGGYGIAQLVSQGGPVTGSGASTSSGQVRHSAARGKAPASLPSAMEPASGSGSAGFTVVRSHTNYRPQRLAAQASSVLGHYTSSHPVPSRVRESTQGSSFGPFGRNLPACVRRVTGGQAPRLVDMATYQGRPAAVIMVPVGGNTVRVWVVGTGCTAAASDVLARASVPETG